MLFQSIVSSSGKKSEMNQLSIMCIDSLLDGLILSNRLCSTRIRNFQNIRNRCVNECVSGCASHSPWHIRYTIMQNPFVDEHGMFMIGWTRGLHATTLVNTD